MDDRASRRQQLLEVLVRKGLEQRDEPFQLTSGAWSRDYVDGKRALADGADLELAARVVLDVVDEAGIGPIDAAGGLTMGADHLSHAVAIVGGLQWFSVRKRAKEHGRKQAVEGAVVQPGMRVLLLDDVVTTGGSIGQALEAIEATGATVVGAVTLADRGDRAAELFASRGVPYLPLLTYRDLGIEAVS